MFTQRRVIRSSLLVVLIGLFVFHGRSQEPRFADPTVNSDGSFKAKLVITPGQSYTVEISTDLLAWQAKYCYTNVADDVSLVDPPTSHIGGRRFYRARLGTGVVSRFSFGFSGYGGAWAQHWVAYPLQVESTAHFIIENAQDYPPPEQVLFMGPIGSGLSNSAAVSVRGWEYESKSASQGLPVVGGEWTILYKGTGLNFDVPEPLVASRLVIPFPEVTERPDGLAVSWTYLDATTGAALSRPPAFLTNVQVTISEASSGVLPPTATQYVFPSLLMPRDAILVIRYEDTLGNTYSVRFSELKP